MPELIVKNQRWRKDDPRTETKTKFLWDKSKKKGVRYSNFGKNYEKVCLRKKVYIICTNDFSLFYMSTPSNVRRRGFESKKASHKKKQRQEEEDTRQLKKKKILFCAEKNCRWTKSGGRRLFRRGGMFEEMGNVGEITFTKSWEEEKKNYSRARKKCK